MSNTQSFENLTLEQAFESLEEITQSFENDELTIDESVSKFEEGLALAKHLKQELGKLENQIQEIKDNYKEPVSEDEM